MAKIILFIVFSFLFFLSITLYIPKNQIFKAVFQERFSSPIFIFVES